MGLLMVQQATGMAVGTSALGTAEGPLLIFSHCGLYSLPSISSLSILSRGLLGFPLTIEIYLILYCPSFGTSGFLYLGWHLTEAPGMSLQVTG